MRFLILINVFFLLACGEASHSDLQQGELGVVEEERLVSLLASPQEIFYEDVSSLVLKSKCISCHSKSGLVIAGVDLESYETLLGENSKKTLTPFNPERSSIYSTLLLPNSQRRHMPPLGKPQLSENQKNLIYQWIINGAKKDSKTPSKRPKTLAEELQVYFKNPERIDYLLVNKHVFSKSCNDCHSDNGSKPDFEDAITYNQNMTNYEDLFSNSGIVPGKLQDRPFVDDEGNLKKERGSRIYRSIAIHQSMPRQKDGYEPVEALHVKLLRLWILNCAIKDFSEIESDNLNEKIDKTGKIRNCNN